MKLMIASDIHGSFYYCEKLIERLKQEKPDKFIILGDILYHGPRNDLPKDYAPKKVIELLNNLEDKPICVKGNCESEVDQMVLNFPIMAEYGVFFLGDKCVYATHGHKIDNGLNLPLQENDILLCGHTHIPVFEKRDKYFYLNPGSVSIPKNGSENSYIILDEKQVTFKNIDGEIYNQMSL